MSNIKLAGKKNQRQEPPRFVDGPGSRKGTAGRIPTSCPAWSRGSLRSGRRSLFAGLKPRSGAGDEFARRDRRLISFAGRPACLLRRPWAARGASNPPLRIGVPSSVRGAARAPLAPALFRVVRGSAPGRNQKRRNDKTILSFGNRVPFLSSVYIGADSTAL